MSIWFDNTDFESELGVYVEKVDGLWDFPKLKNEGIEWSDRDYNEAYNRDIYFQYDSRQITLDCVMVADSWATLKSKLLTLSYDLKYNYNELSMLVLPKYSMRGYLVRLKKTTILQPAYYFESGKSIATFKLVFEEPQAFNTQISLYFPNVTGTVETSINITISKATKSLSFKSDEQQYITVHFSGKHTEVNLEQEDFSYSNSAYEVTNNRPYPLVITGEIDNIESVNISVDSESGGTIIGATTADYFLRNGSITVE